MIYTLTLNPAIDYVMHMDKLHTGRINRSAAESVFFGGKGINVSLVLRELGVTSVATGFIAGFTGDALADGISDGGIVSDFVKLERGLTRINVKLRSEEETDVNAVGPDVTGSDIDKLLKKLSRLEMGDTLVLAGSIPGKLPRDTYEKIMASLSGKGVRFAVDAEGEVLTHSLRYAPFMVKPNAEELGDIFGVEITCENVFGYTEKMQEMGAKNVLVSMGGDGAVLLDENGRRHIVSAHRIALRNTVGAGDSCLAGFLAGFAATGDYGYALRLGNAAGGATAECDGLATGEEIQRMFKR